MREEYDIKTLNPRKNPYAKRKNSRIWAADNYIENGEGFESADHITPELVEKQINGWNGEKQ